MLKMLDFLWLLVLALAGSQRDSAVRDDGQPSFTDLPPSHIRNLRIASYYLGLAFRTEQVR